MRPPKRSLFVDRRLSTAWALPVILSATLAACGAEKNHADRERLVGVDAGYQGPDEALLPGDHTYDPGRMVAPYCIKDCLPDPGSYPNLPDEAQQTLCAQEEEGLEFMPLKLWDFTKTNVARNTYRYDDGSTRLQWPAYSDGLQGNPGVPADQFITAAGWDPPTSKTNFCGKPHTYAFHFSGGPYNYYGGGIGRAFKCLNSGSGYAPLIQGNLPVYDAYPNLPKTEDPGRRKVLQPYCSGGEIVGACSPQQADPLVKSVCPLRDQQYMARSTLPEPPGDAALLGQTLDFSQWEGIAVWARRGPEGQAGIRVMVGDKYVDEEMSFLQYLVDPTAIRYCENVKICDCAGQFKRCTYAATWDETAQSYKTTKVYNGSTQLMEEAGYRCFEPTTGDQQPKITSDYDACGQTMCNQGEPAYQMLDPRFHGKPCTAWTSYTGRQDYYCYDPATDPPPAETYQRCGDYWMAGIRLTTDWHLYLVPFTEMHQQGWAKPSNYLDLTAASVLRLTWDRGWIDYWVAEVKLYRWKR